MAEGRVTSGGSHPRDVTEDGAVLGVDGRVQDPTVVGNSLDGRLGIERTSDPAVLVITGSTTFDLPLPLNLVRHVSAARRPDLFDQGAVGNP